MNAMFNKKTLYIVGALLLPSLAQASIPSMNVTLIKSIFNSKYQVAEDEDTNKTTTTSDKQSICSAQTRFARTAMIARQYSVPKETVAEIIEDSKDADVSDFISMSFIKDLVKKAYETPVKRRTPEKKEAINSFSDSIKKECETDFEENGEQIVGKQATLSVTKSIIIK